MLSGRLRHLAMELPGAFGQRRKVVATQGIGAVMVDWSLERSIVSNCQECGSFLIEFMTFEQSVGRVHRMHVHEQLEMLREQGVGDMTVWICLSCLDGSGMLGLRGVHYG
jgi:hypothetical protein